MKTLKEIKKIQKDRSNFEILRNVLECDDNNKGTDCNGNACTCYPSTFN